MRRRASSKWPRTVKRAWRGAGTCFPPHYSGKWPSFDSTSLEPHGQILMTSDQQAVDPTRLMLGVEGDGAGTIEEHGEDVASLDPRQGRSDAVMDPPPKRHMATRHATS